MMEPMSKRLQELNLEARLVRLGVLFFAVAF